MIATARTYFLAIVLASVALPAPAAEPSFRILHTSGSVRFALWSDKPEKPAPTLFIFAAGLEDMENTSYATEIGRILAKKGYLYVALDPPCHGADIKDKEPGQLPGWRYRLERGGKLIEPFTTRASSVLDHLVKEGYTDPGRVAACGISRGGFLAYHFAAAEPRVRAAIGFAPVTNLLALREFVGMEKHEATRALNLASHADKLVGKGVWMSIGNDDDRVNTDDAIAFMRKVVAASVAGRKGPRTVVPVELIVGGTVGHTDVSGSHAMAAQWLDAYLGRK